MYGVQRVPVARMVIEVSGADLTEVADSVAWDIRQGIQGRLAEAVQATPFQLLCDYPITPRMPRRGLVVATWSPPIDVQAARLGLRMTEV